METIAFSGCSQFVILTKSIQGGRDGWTCSTHRRYEKSIQNFNGETLREDTIWDKHA
jgi:hypothetical protein